MVQGICLGFCLFVLVHIFICGFCLVIVQLCSYCLDFIGYLWFFGLAFSNLGV